MREPRPDWSTLGVSCKILDEHPHLFLYSSPPTPGAYLHPELRPPVVTLEFNSVGTSCNDHIATLIITLATLIKRDLPVS